MGQGRIYDVCVSFVLYCFGSFVAYIFLRVKIYTLRQYISNCLFQTFVFLKLC